MNTSKLLYYVDFLKSPYLLKVNDSMYFSSKLSLACSLFFILLATVISFWFSYSFWYDRPFTVISSSNLHNSKSPYTLDSDDIRIVLSFTVFNSITRTFSDTPKISLASQFIINQITNFDGKNLNIEDLNPGEFLFCDDKEVAPFYADGTDFIADFYSNSDKYLCYMPRKSLEIGGSSFSADGRGALEMNLNLDFPALYADLMGERSEKEAFTAFMDENILTAHIAFKNKVTDVDSSDGFRFEYKSFSANSFRDGNLASDVYLEKTSVFSDQSIAFDYPPNSEEVFFPVSGVDSYTLAREPNTEENYILYTISYKLNTKETRIYRQYERLEQMLAGLSAILQVLFIGVSLVNTVFKYDLLDVYLAGQLYFNENKPEKVLDNACSINSARSVAELKQGNNQEIAKKVPVWRIMTKMCRKRLSPSEMMLEKAKKYLYYDIDLFTLVKKSLQAEKLTKIFLKRDQIALINLLNVRKINFDVQEELVLKEAKENLTEAKEDTKIDWEEPLTKNILDRLKDFS